jgi:hypothetical protein
MEHDHPASQAKRVASSATQLALSRRFICRHDGVSRVARADCSLDRFQKIDKSLPIVPEAELVTDRRNFRCKSQEREILTDQAYGASVCAEKIFAGNSISYYG